MSSGHFITLHRVFLIYDLHGQEYYLHNNYNIVNLRTRLIGICQAVS